MNISQSNISQQDKIQYQEISYIDNSQEQSVQKKNLLPQMKEMLQRTRQNVIKFVKFMGNIKNSHFNLSKYRISSSIQKSVKSLKGEGVLDIINNIIRKMNTNKRLKKNWNQQDIIILIWIIQKYNFIKGKTSQNYDLEDWNFIANRIPGKTSDLCMFKWLNLQKLPHVPMPWSQKEDQMLRQLIQNNNQNIRWNQISKDLYLRCDNFKVYRPAKKCRQRWQCYLNPTIRKGVWSAEQDLILIQSSFEIGNKWSQISKKLKGRTENAVKNRYNLLCQKMKKQKQCSYESHRDFLQHYLKQLQVNLMLSPQTQAQLSTSMSCQIEQLEYQVQLKKQKHTFQTLKYKSLQEYEESEQNQIKFKKVKIDEIINLGMSLMGAQYNEQQSQMIFFESNEELTV